MGREIRRVPPNYEHKKLDASRYPYREGYQPMYAHAFTDRFNEWLGDFDRIRAGKLNDLERECYPGGLSEWLQDDGQPPDPAYYNTVFTEDEATWFQVWETVSEGTPVSPPFETRDELIDYLAAKGDFWDQKRGHGAWPKENATSFVNAGWVPSLIAMHTADGSTVKAPRDGAI